MTSALLMLGQNEVKMFRVIDRIKDGKDSTARIADWFPVRVPSLMGQSNRADNSQTWLTPMRSIISWKISPPLNPINLFRTDQHGFLQPGPIYIRVIQLGEMSVLQRRDLIPLGFLVECRTRDGPRISKPLTVLADQLR